MHHEHSKSAPDTPGAYARGTSRNDMALDHVASKTHACTTGCPGYPDLKQREIAVPEQGFICNACKEPAPWDEGWDVTVATVAQDHTLVAYRQVCNSCMNKTAPLLVVYLTQDPE